MITDTQVLSYYYKGSLVMPSEPVRISSITAAEFLLIQSAQHNRANYYPILPAWLRHPTAPNALASSPRSLFDSRRHAVLGKHRTDQLILDLGPSVPTYVEFGSVAITQLINEGHELLFMASIAHLDKPEQKKLLARFRFLQEQSVSCIAVTPLVAEIGLNLLGQFLDRYQPKENKRNTVNDVLILATAIQNSSELLTEDKLLARFAAEVVDAPVVAQGELLKLDFTQPSNYDRRRPLESKGYVNRGWQVLERRGRGA